MIGEPRRFVVAYDIVDDRRRSAVANILARHGDRIQYSVFIVDARESRMVRLKAKIGDVVDKSVDSVLICDLGPHHCVDSAGLEFIGQRRQPTSHGPLVL